MRIAALALALAIAGAYAQKLKDIKPSRLNLFSQQQDVQLGKEAAAQIEQQVALVTDEQLNAFINRIGSQLTKQSEAGQYPYTFKVVYDKSINAFALPGGPTYTHTGLISQADNEAQIAGVLAHEISHVALRHGTAQVSKANAAQLLAGFGGALLGGGSLLGQLAQMGAGLGANSLLLKFSRDAESDADLLGARMMAKAGYDPVEMAKFFQKLEDEEKRSGRSTPQFLSDHPSPGNRVKAVQDQMKLMPQANYNASNDAQLRQMKSIIEKLPVPAKANANFRQAGDPQGARPSSGAKQYKGQGLSFRYPDNWQAAGNQQSSEVTLAHPEGMVNKNGQGDIAYGAILGVQQAQGTDLQANTAQYIKSIMQGNGLTAGKQANQSIQIAGTQGLLNVLYGQSAFRGQREVVVVITANHPNGLFYMILITPENEYSAAQPAFENMIASVEFTR